MYSSYNIINSNILTLDDSCPIANSITIENGKIIAINSPKSTFKSIDCNSATIVPGITDSHFHLKNLGKRLEQLDLKGIKSIEKIVDMVEQKTKKLPSGAWIKGFGWDQSLWPNENFPTAKVLNKISPSHPIMLTRVDGHSIWVNDLALKLSGYDVNNPQAPDGGKIINNCILLDNAMNKIWDVQPEDSFSDVKRWIKIAANAAASRGITNVHDAWQDQYTIDAIKELIAENNFPIRCYGMLGSGYSNLLNEYFQNGHYNSDLYTIRSVKAFIDGALGSRGAALLEPYSDDHCNCGLILISNEEFSKLSKECNDASFQLCTHAIGDKGNRIVLDTYRNATKNSHDHRWRIEHAQMVADEDIPKFLEYNILPSMQPSHCTSDMRWMDKRIGLDRLSRVSRWKSFIDLGIPIPGGSDCPIEDGEPLFEYYAAVTRQNHNGWPKGGWQPQEKIGRLNALKMFTSWAAFGEFSEHRRGQIKLGFDADFTIFDKDITKCSTNEILETQLIATIVNGGFSYNPFSL